MSDPFKDAMAKISAEYSDIKPENKSFGEEVMGIPGTILSSTLGLVGVERSPEQILYERKYPVTSFFSGLVGFGGPYTGAYKVLKGAKRLESAIEGIKFAGSPIKTAMVQEAARAGVIETARLGIGAVIPDGEPLEDMFADSVLNIGLGSVGVGAFKTLAQGGKRKAPLQEIFKDIDLDASPQFQIRQLKDQIAAGSIDPKYLNEARNRVAVLEGKIRTEVVDAGAYVGPTLKSGGKRLSKLFYSKSKTDGTVRQRYAKTERAGFKTDIEWQTAALRAGLPTDWINHVKVPRRLTFKAEEGARRAQGTIYRTMASAGDGWYMTREANDGLFVMAKRVKGKPTTPHVDDEWMIFKTDNPGHFKKGPQAWMDQVADHNLFLAKTKPVAGDVSPIFNSARDLMATVPLRKYVGIGAAKGTIADMSQKLVKMLGADEALKGTGEMTKKIADFATHYLAPTVQQFGRSPRAGRVFAIASATNDAAEALQREIVYGTKELTPGKSAFSNLIRGNPGAFKGDSIQKALEDLSEKDVQDFWTLWKEQADPAQVGEMFAQGKISKKAHDFAVKMKEFDDTMTGMIARTEEAVGNQRLTPAAGHFGLSRSWDGDLRVAIRDSEEKLIGIAAGQSRVSAKKAADRLVDDLVAQGHTARVAEEFDITNTVKLPRDLKPHVSSPAWVLERQGLAGYKHFDKPFTKKELLDAYASNVRKRTKYMANATITNLLADDIAKVSMEDPTMHTILTERLNDLAGQRSALAKIQEQVVDSVLSLVMGKNTASGIVSATNKLMWHLELGALRIAYPVMNMLTFMQTVLPEAAFVRTAGADTLAKYYTTWGLHGGKAAAPMGALDPIKMWWQGTKQMHVKGDARWDKAVARGINEGVLDPRFIEEAVGQTSAQATNLASAMKSGGMVPWLKAVSEYLPAQSEKWSRLNSFSTAYKMGKDVLGLQDDELLYKFAKDFTDRTMFRYGMEARPRVFTTPAGSALGLFKNWMMHYMGMMADYTGEGVMKNNWNPLMWQTAGTFAVGGLAATPLYGVANAFAQATTGKSALVKTYENLDFLPDQVSDAIVYGLPAGLSGISLSGASQSPLANPARDVTQMFSLVQADRGKAIANAFQGGMDYMEATGQNPLSDPNTRDMLARAVTPKTLYRGLQVTQDGAIKSLTTGNPVVKNLGPIDQYLFQLGFNPVKLERAYAVADELWTDQTKMKKAVQTMGEALSHAYERNDQKEMQAIVGNALALGVDLSSVERSAMSRLAKQEGDIITRGFKPEAIEEKLAALGDDYKYERKN